MAVHWTYTEFEETSDLAQGDIIGLSPELQKIIREIHPYFDDPRYLGYLVLTQTCDLVRRGDNGCKARYLTLSVIRELHTVFPKILEEICGTTHRSILNKQKKIQAEQFLERLIDQNEQSRGMFYLHSDIDSGIGKDSVAFLQITFSLKRKHYDAILNARKGRLNPEFTNKLGWLSGNLFSRVATPDWEEKEGKGSGQKNVSRILDSMTGLHWFPASTLSRAERSDFDSTGLSISETVSRLSEFSIGSPMAVLKQELNEIAYRLFIKNAKESIKTILLENEELWQKVGEEITRQITSELEASSFNEIVSKLKKNDKVRNACNTLFIKAIESTIDEEGEHHSALKNYLDVQSGFRPLIQAISEFANSDEIESDANTVEANTIRFSNDVINILQSNLQELSGEKWETSPERCILESVTNRVENSQAIRSILKNDDSK